MDIKIKRFLLFLLFLMLFSYSLHTISDLDVWLHLKTGEWIIQHYQIPKTSLFSFPTENSPWYDVYWLFQVLIFLIYKISGINGLIFFKVSVLALSFFFLFNIRDKEKNSDYTIPVASLMLAILISNERFIIRPELMSYLFLAIYLYVLYTYKYYGSKYIYLLPVLNIIWVNMHGLYVMGLVLVLAYLFGELIMWKVPALSFSDDSHVLKGKRYLTIVYLFFILVLSSFINPYPSETILMPLQLFKGLKGITPQLGTPGIPELIPPFSEHLLFPTQVVFYYKILIILSIFSFLINIRKINVTHLLVYAAFLYISLKARRNISYFAIIAAPVMSLNIRSFISDIRYRLEGKGRVWKYGKVLTSVFQITLILTITFYIYDVTTNRYYIRDRSNKRFGLGISAITFPVKAVDFILENDIKGNMFNNTFVGDYLIWRCYPERKTFVDGRLDFSGRYLFHYTDPVFWDNIVNTYNINYALIGYGWSPNTMPLIKMLFNSNDWILVYFDDIAAIFIKNIPKNEHFIERFGIDRNNIYTRGHVNTISGHVLPVSVFHTGNFYTAIGLDELAETEYKKCIEQYPEYLEAHFALAELYARKGLLEKAEEEYTCSLRIKPQFAGAHLGLADIYAQKGLLNEAIFSYKEALRIEPNLLSAHNNLGFVYIQLKRYPEAISEFEAVLRIDPDNNMARELINLLQKNTKTNF
jgi:hypothetical protein